MLGYFSLYATKAARILSAPRTLSRFGLLPHEIAERERRARNIEAARDSAD